VLRLLVLQAGLHTGSLLTLLLRGIRLFYLCTAQVHPALGFEATSTVQEGVPLPGRSGPLASFCGRLDALGTVPLTGCRRGSVHMLHFNGVPSFYSHGVGIFGYVCLVQTTAVGPMSICLLPVVQPRWLRNLWPGAER